MKRPNWNLLFAIAYIGIWFVTALLSAGEYLPARGPTHVSWHVVWQIPLIFLVPFWFGWNAGNEWHNRPPYNRK